MATPQARRFGRMLLGTAAFGAFTLTMGEARAFDCAKAYLGVDYAICSDPKLVASIDDMGQVWQRLKAALPADEFNTLLSEQRQWLKSYGTECGLPPKGQPTEQQIAKAMPCIRDRIDARLKYLTGLEKPRTASASAGYAWKTGFAQGTTEALIRNDADSTFTVSCPSGQIETAPSFVYSTFRQLEAKDAPIAFSLIIDDTKERLYLKRSSDGGNPPSYGWTAANERQIAEMADMVERIRTARYLAIEQTGSSVRDEFSTRNAATALNRVLRGCEAVTASDDAPATAPTPAAAQPTARPAPVPTPSPAASPPVTAGAMPACNSGEVQEKVTHAVFRDLSVMGVPVLDATRQYLQNGIRMLTLDVSDLAQGARQQMSLSTRLPAENIQVCAEKPGVRSGIVAIVMKNPKRPSQWGIMALNYGVPGRVAMEGLEFLDRR